MMNIQRDTFDVITLIWQKMKPHLAALPVKDWDELMNDQAELSRYIDQRYGDSFGTLAAKLMMDIAEFIRANEKEGN
jgi:hypothetical protein